MNALETSYGALDAEDGGALGSLSGASEALSEISGLKAEYSAIFDKLNELYYSLEDVKYTLRDAKDNFEYDGSRLDTIENRLDLIASLKRKYGAGIDEVLAYKEKCSREVEELNTGEEQKALLENEFSKLSAEYGTLADELSRVRHDSAAILEQEIVKQLDDLGLAKSRFEICFERLEAEFSENGFDKVEFLLSANAGEPVKPLSKIASGGEISRIMLALKTVLALSDDIPTLIFDEIDTGISGRIASVVGEKMVSISGSHQVICVTHLPQIAALADSHYLAEKHSTESSSTSVLRKLDIQERYQEVARIMGSGEASELALRHATEMIDTVAAKKKSGGFH
jgi:DNA repair protein RecN (Recombination protein N)